MSEPIKLTAAEWHSDKCEQYAAMAARDIDNNQIGSAREHEHYAKMHGDYAREYGRLAAENEQLRQLLDDAEVKVQNVLCAIKASISSVKRKTRHEWTKPIADVQIGFIPTCIKCGAIREVISSEYCDDEKGKQ